MAHTSNKSIIFCAAKVKAQPKASELNNTEEQGKILLLVQISTLGMHLKIIFYQLIEPLFLFYD